MTTEPPAPARPARWCRLPGGRDLRSGLWLTWSGSIAQMMPLAAAPLLTRIYTPAQFGIYAAVSVAVLILATVAAGRYDMAVVVAGSAHDAVLLVSVSCRVAAASCAGAGVVVGGLWLGQVLGDGIGPLLLALPVITLVATWDNALNQYAIRRDDVRRIFGSSLVRAGVLVTLQVVLGLLGAGVVGLLAAAAAAGAAGNLWLLPAYRADLRRYGPAPAGRRAARVRVARAYARFPRGDVTASLLNSAASGITVFGVAAVFTPAVVGWYSLAARVGTLPALTAGAAISRVYYRRAASIAAAGRPLRPQLRRTAGLTALAALPLFAIAMLIGPAAFAVVFGEQWREAGAYLVAMAPLLWLRLAVSPVSTTLLVTGRHAVNVSWNLALVLVTAGGLAVAAVAALSPVAYLWLNSGLAGLAYLALFLLAHASAGANWRTHDRTAGRVSPRTAGTGTHRRPVHADS